MRENNNEKYPLGYKEARKEFSPEFIAAFDQCIEDNTTGFFTAVGMLTIVLIPFSMCSDWLYSKMRQNLYRGLIELAADKERCAIVNKGNANSAFANKVIELKDLLNCPLNSLEQFLQPEVLHALQTDAKKVERKKQALIERISVLKEEKKAGASNRDAEIERATQELSQQKTVLERLREGDYSNELIISLIPKPEKKINAPKVEVHHSETPSPVNTPNQKLIPVPINIATPKKPVKRQVLPDVSKINPSFFMDLMAHPATLTVSAILGVTSLLVLGLVAPLPLALFIGAIVTAVVGLGFFAGSCAALIEKQKRVDLSAAPAI